MVIASQADKELQKSEGFINLQEKITAYAAVQANQILDNEYGRTDNDRKYTQDKRNIFNQIKAISKDLMQKHGAQYLITYFKALEKEDKEKELIRNVKRQNGLRMILFNNDKVSDIIQGILEKCENQEIVRQAVLEQQVPKELDTERLDYYLDTVVYNQAIENLNPNKFSPSEMADHIHYQEYCRQRLSEQIEQLVDSACREYKGLDAAQVLLAIEEHMDERMHSSHTIQDLRSDIPYITNKEISQIYNDVLNTTISKQENRYLQHIDKTKEHMHQEH